MNKEARAAAQAGYMAGYTYKQQEAVQAAYLAGYMDKEADGEQGWLAQLGSWLGEQTVDKAHKGYTYTTAELDKAKQISEAGMEGLTDSGMYRTLNDAKKALGEIGSFAGENILHPAWSAFYDANKAISDNVVVPGAKLGYKGLKAGINSAYDYFNPPPATWQEQLQDYYSNVLTKPENWGPGTTAAAIGAGALGAGAGGYGLYNALTAETEKKKKKAAPRRRRVVA